MKVKIVLLLVTLALVSLQAEGRARLREEVIAEINNSTNETASNITTAYIMSAMRGFWFGYNEALYTLKNPSLSDDCLGQDVTNKIDRIIDAMINFDAFQFFQICGDTTAVLFSVGECGVEGSIQDVYSFCSTNDCSIGTVGQNLGNNIFALFEIGNNVVSTAIKFPADSNEKLFKQTETFGQAIGFFIKLLFNIQKL